MVECPLTAAKAAEVEPEPEPVTQCMDEGTIDINGYKISGIRTYSIILLIVLAYAYLAIRYQDVVGMKDLALMACGFLFGLKTVVKK